MAVMLKRVSVSVAGRQYESIVGQGILPRTGEFAQQVLPPGRCALITDSHVAPLYADVVTRSLEEVGYKPTVIAIAAGEKSKSMESAEAVCDQMIEAGLDRSAFVVALGGGVIGDLAGFVASIYYRGIPHVQIPTTVVAQVDSAIGGKAGVNARDGKNLIGSFHQPVQVITDSAVLLTLPQREFNEGIAEMIKHAVIRDAEMLDDLPQAIVSDLTALIARNQQIKAQIVSEDEFEKLGFRALLNFGHTIGHAIENASGYGRYLHGEAISLGISAALDLSIEKAGLPLDQAEKVRAALSAFDLPLQLPPEVSSEVLMNALRRDKKFDRGSIRFVLTRSLGSAFVSKEITDDDLRRVIRNLKAPA
jgi:3-dehydroquinate synthase